MAVSLAHRGPDGQGTWANAEARVGLASRRLAVVDLSPAAGQPMCDRATGSCLVFNGEIYNHKEVRASIDAGARVAWETDHSDTEVLLRAFQRWGTGCLQRLEGMFAFAFWDEGEKELWLVRDRIGVKPLYYSLNDERLAFASEIKALLCDPGGPPGLDEEAMFHYLSFLTTPAPWTIYKGICKLPPGSWLRLGADGQVEVRKWWDPLDQVEPRPGIAGDEAAELVLSELERSIQLRKMADVPVGIFLSGGVDSSTNAILFSRGERCAAQTFTVGYGQASASYPSELPFARSVSELVGSQHHELVLEPDDLVEFLGVMAKAQDEPLGDPVCFPLYHLARLARQAGVPVVQVGEGADELFAGYPRWHQLLRAQRWARFAPRGSTGKAALNLLAPLLQQESFSYEYARRAVSAKPVFWGGAEGFGEVQKRRLLSSRLRHDFAGTSSWEVLSPIRDDFAAKGWDQSALSWMTYLDLRLRLPELLLMRVDKMTMAWGVEARVPFLDPRLVTAVLGLPAPVRLGDGPKSLLKRAVAGVVPRDVLARPKQGFGVPLKDWMDGPIRPVAVSTLERFCRGTDLLDPVATRALLDGPRRDQAWYLLNLALWWEALGSR